MSHGPPTRTICFMSLSVVAPFVPAEANVLVAYVNSAVALGLAARLLSSSSVTLAALPDAVQMLRGPGRIDVVVSCPYLTEAERTLLTEACERRAGSPPCVELVDTPGRMTTQLAAL